MKLFPQSILYPFSYSFMYRWLQMELSEINRQCRSESQVCTDQKLLPKGMTQYLTILTPKESVVWLLRICNLCPWNPPVPFLGSKIMITSFFYFIFFFCNISESFHQKHKQTNTWKAVLWRHLKVHCIALNVQSQFLVLTSAQLCWLKVSKGPCKSSFSK